VSSSVKEEPCGENGSCEPAENDNGYICNCNTGWSGDACDEDVDECTDGTHSCLNGGQCVNEEGKFSRLGNKCAIF